jgi:outer membrane protein assembly factor BamB
MTNAEVSERPVLRDGTLYVVNANDTVLAIDPETGKLRWSQARTPAGAMEVAGYAGPLVWRGKVYAGFSDGTVTAYDARSGAERWQPVDLAAEAEQLLGELPTYLDVDTTPIAYEGPEGPLVVVGSYAGGVYALDAETGTPVWHNPSVGGVSDLLLWTQPAHRAASGGGGALIPAREILVAATGTTGLWGLDPATGEPLWRQRLPQGGVSQPVAISGALLVSASQLGLFLISPLDGSLIDGVHLANGVSMIPAVHGFRAFVMTNGGQFLAMHVAPPG